MAKIKIQDLPADDEISKEEMKKVFGGWVVSSSWPSISTRSTLIYRPSRLFSQEEEEEPIQP